MVALRPSPMSTVVTSSRARSAISVSCTCLACTTTLSISYRKVDLRPRRRSAPGQQHCRYSIAISCVRGPMPVSGPLGKQQASHLPTLNPLPSALGSESLLSSAAVAPHVVTLIIPDSV